MEIISVLQNNNNNDNNNNCHWFMVGVHLCQVTNALGKLICTGEARVTLECHSYASLVLRSLTRSSVTWRTHANHDPMIKCVRTENNCQHSFSRADQEHLLKTWGHFLSGKAIKSASLHLFGSELATKITKYWASLILLGDQVTNNNFFYYYYLL